MYEQLTAALDEFEANDSLHALVISGHGNYFTSGADMKEMPAYLVDKSVRRPSQSPVYTFMHRIIACKKMLVAAVNGCAIGIGVTLLMHCDLVYAAESATFCTPFLRVGIVPEFASSYTFPHFLGPIVANDFIIRSKVYTAQEALNVKLVSDVFPTNGFLEKVLAEVEPIVTNHSNKMILPLYKSLLRREYTPKILKALASEFDHMDRRAASSEYLEFVLELKKKFNKKRSKL
ncbi:enoyl-hydratase [Plasmopara halstedii]|uniref:Enoyl-hydratase n=1 Tax=Plasmopara halstedii TaxID=4781 RepID=A0A0P1AN21_PLAHL|nr:enoyl-hydratase [Plasmopara halstedii]CEG42638.1 enoyl-hydratase [Plasmopara halstedii]|eukprot:XP_024579007.1 enoyl-hydratase [Plasmopara halstedii]